ncbi:MAG: hypothetical protein NTW49_00685 [Bacteroidia bacterium]|nr:hypothetical protein [Bacteroidia bacterium]
MLLDKFLSGDISKVAEIEDYLTKQLSGDDYVALYPFEQWLILYWTKNYDKLIQNIKHYDSICSTLHTKIFPQPDNLSFRLKEKTYSNKQLIISWIKNSSISEQDKDFLIMNLYLLLITKETKDITQDTLNYRADKFIQKYHDNDLISFTRKYIRQEYVPSKWAYSFEIFSGYGIFSGDLKNDFSDNIPIGVAFDVYYKNISLYLRDYIGFSRTKHDFTGNGDIWNKNSQVRVYLPEASFGYIVHESKHFKLAPFAGISSTSVSPTENDLNIKPDLKNYELSFI